MKNEKQRLTKIINGVKEKIVDGADLYGYSGISKDMILNSLSESYNLLGLLDDFENEFEAIWAKRKLSKYFDELFSLLKEVNTDKWEEKFDRFLDLVSKLRMHTKDIYLTLTNKPIRIDLDIQEARDKYSELIESSNGIEARLKTIQEGSSNTAILLNELTEIKENLLEINREGTEIIQSVKNVEANANESNLIIEDITPQITSTFTEIRELKKSVISEEEKLTKLIANIEENIQKVNKTQSDIQNQIAANSELQDQIKQTLQDVNKHGLAASFLKRKSELGTTVGIWGVLSIVSIAVLIWYSYNFAVYVVSVDNFDPIRNLFKIPSVIAGVWLCWFSVKQYGYAIRIREDYSYKCAISMAFEGYKNETRDVDHELLKKLLETTVANVSTNPVILYNTKTNHGSPINEFTESIRNFLRIGVKFEGKADTNDLTKLLP